MGVPAKQAVLLSLMSRGIKNNAAFGQLTPICSHQGAGHLEHIHPPHYGAQFYFECSSTKVSLTCVKLDSLILPAMWSPEHVAGTIMLTVVKLASAENARIISRSCKEVLLGLDVKKEI